MNDLIAAWWGFAQMNSGIVFLGLIASASTFAFGFRAGYQWKQWRTRRREKSRALEAGIGQERRFRQDDHKKRVHAAQETLAFYVNDPELHHHIDAGGTPEQHRELIAHTRRVWSAYGKEDPYWSVLTYDEYRMTEMDADSEKAFYASGAEEAGHFFKACEYNDVSVPWNGTIIDFGCGLGRIGEHLAARFANYIGVDISPAHLARARARFDAKGIRSGRFMLLSDYLDREISSDAFFSVIVLQHNPPPIIALLLERLCTMLRPGGVAYFQVPTAFFGYEFRVTDYLQNLPAHGGREMHALPQREVFRILHRNKCCPLDTFPDGRALSLGISMTFLAQKTIGLQTGQGMR